MDNHWMFIFGGGIIADEIQKQNKEKVKILNEKKNFFRIIKKITKYCKENKIEIITVHHGGIYTNLIYIALKFMNKNLKFVRYLHSCFETDIKNATIKEKIDKIVLQKAIDKSDLIVCVSNAVKVTHDNNLKLKGKRVEVIYNGINGLFLEDDVIGRRYNINGNFNFIYVGRLERVKGVDILLDAFPMVKSKYKNIKLVVIGDGTQLENLKQKAKDNNIDENVEFLGKQVDVKKWLDKADIFIYPVVWEEAFGISVVEAMSRGVIPITFKRGGLPEIIDSEKNGYLVDKIDSKDLANKIVEILNNYELNKMREAAIKTSKI